MCPRPTKNIIEPLFTNPQNIFSKMVGVKSKESPFPIVPKKYPISPLRYPGGKNRAVRSILTCIPKNITELCSPFLGGGSVELACTQRKIKVFGYDSFFVLINFWDQLLKEPELLSNKVQRYLPMTKAKFYNLQRICLTIKDRIEQAAAFYALNRCSFSGTTLSGGMSPGHPRFTQSSINRLKKFKVDNFSVGCLDFKESLKKHKDTFLYLDPPYANGQKLYGNRGDNHKNFNHIKLAQNLYKRDRWILSYNGCKFIQDLYKDYQFIDLNWKYGMNSTKQSNEVLIISKDLAA
jgi:DNA adenine methylase